MNDHLENANQYFSTRFWDKEPWLALSSDERRLALSTSETDINALLGTDNVEGRVIKDKPPFSFYQKAIFEWALFLVSNRDEISKLLSRAASGITERKVDGFGRETYKDDGVDSDAYLEMIKRSPAGRMLRAIRDDNRIIR